MKILLLEQDEEARERIMFAIESSYTAEIIAAAGIPQAIAAISRADHGIELMICDTHKATLQEFEGLQGVSAKIPAIFCVDSKSLNQPTLGWNVLAVVDRTSLILNILGALDKLSNKGVVAKNEFSDDDFCKIKTSLLLSVCPLKGDIFIRLGEAKYIKLFNEGDEFNAEDMEKYTGKKGIEYLYLRKSATGEFIEKYNADLQTVSYTHLTLPTNREV